MSVLPFVLERQKTALLVVDMQERIWTAIESKEVLLNSLLTLLQGCQQLQISIFLSEQAPQHLGLTVPAIQNLLGRAYRPWPKTSFSCLDDPQLAEMLTKAPFSQWVVMGIEAHICVLQTAIGLLRLEKQVVVVGDATASRSDHDYSMALAEMRASGIRVSSVETLLFELVGNATDPIFKSMSTLIKSRYARG